MKRIVTIVSSCRRLTGFLKEPAYFWPSNSHLMTPTVPRKAWFRNPCRGASILLGYHPAISVRLDLFTAPGQQPPVQVTPAFRALLTIEEFLGQGQPIPWDRISAQYDYAVIRRTQRLRPPYR